MISPPTLGSFDYQPRTRIVFANDAADRVGELAQHLGARRVLVVTDPRSPVPRMGLDVDRVLGLVDGACPVSTDGSVVADRRPMSGRMACVLDPARLVARAREVIEGSFASGE